MSKMNDFVALTTDEAISINGGMPGWGEACAIVALVGGAIVGGFNAGRQFVRDIRNKLFG